jgi:hypothetical protein
MEDRGDRLSGQQGAAQLLERRKREIVSGIVLAALAVAIYAVVVLKFVATT